MRNLYEYANRAMKLLDDIGIDYGIIDIWEVNTRAHKRWGQCSELPEGGYKISINADLLDERNSEDGLMNTLLHELLHSCEDCMNHGAKWQALAREVKRHYGYDIKRCSNAEEKGAVYVTEVKATKEYVIKCPCCGATWIRHRKCDLVNFPELYSCGNCHTSLKRIK